MVVFLLLILIIFLGLALSWWWAVRRTKYWKNKGVQSPPAKPFIGNLFALNDVRQLYRWSKQFGRTYGIQEGWRNVLVTSDVEILHQVFVCKFQCFPGRKMIPLAEDTETANRVHVFNARGQRWKNLRNLCLQPFTVKNIKKLLPGLEESARSLVNSLDHCCSCGSTVNILSFLQDMTAEILTRIAMGGNGGFIQTEAVQLTKDVFSAHRKSGNSWWLKKLNFCCAILPWMTPLLQYLAGLNFLMDANDTRMKGGPFRALCDQLAELGWIAREKMELKDLLQDDEQKSTKKGLEMDEIFFEEIMKTVGFDTIANSLACSILELAKHPDVQHQLQEEIDRVCPNGSTRNSELLTRLSFQTPTYDHLVQMSFAEVVIKETLRLYPIVAFASARTCSEETKVGELVIEKGTIVQADVFSIHRNPSIWGVDAKEFRPERWLSGGSTDVGPRRLLDWFPFGVGPRNCIGAKLAYMEEKLVLLHIFRQFNVLCCSDTEKKLKLVGSAVMGPESVRIRVERRWGRDRFPHH